MVISTKFTLSFLMSVIHTLNPLSYIDLQDFKPYYRSSWGGLYYLLKRWNLVSFSRQTDKYFFVCGWLDYYPQNWNIIILTFHFQFFFSLLQISKLPMLLLLPEHSMNEDIEGLLIWLEIDEELDGEFNEYVACDATDNREREDVNVVPLTGTYASMPVLFSWKSEDVVPPGKDSFGVALFPEGDTKDNHEGIPASLDTPTFISKLTTALPSSLEFITLCTTGKT